MTATDLRKLGQLPWRDRWLLAEAMVSLGLARLSILTLPFRWLVASEAGRYTRNSATGAALEGQQIVHARRVRWAIGVAAGHTPWQSNCLAQALAARGMLKWRRTPSTLHLGVRKDDGGQLEAHAWLRCDNMAVTGGRGQEHYAVLGTFFGKGLDR